jgi:CBS domain-containing protein
MFPSILRKGVAKAARSAFSSTPESVSSLASASTAWEKSCYNNIDYTISDDLTVFDAVQRFSAFNIGALVTVDGSGKLSGVISEDNILIKLRYSAALRKKRKSRK